MAWKLKSLSLSPLLLTRPSENENNEHILLLSVEWRLIVCNFIHVIPLAQMIKWQIHVSYNKKINEQKKKNW